MRRKPPVVVGAAALALAINAALAGALTFMRAEPQTSPSRVIEAMLVPGLVRHARDPRALRPLHAPSALRMHRPAAPVPASHVSPVAPVPAPDPQSGSAAQQPGLWRSLGLLERCAAGDLTGMTSQERTRCEARLVARRPDPSGAYRPQKWLIDPHGDWVRAVRESESRAVPLGRAPAHVCTDDGPGRNLGRLCPGEEPREVEGPTPR